MITQALITRSLLALRDLGPAHAYLSVDTQNPADVLSLYEAEGYKFYKRQFDMIRPFSRTDIYRSSKPSLTI